MTRSASLQSFCLVFDPRRSIAKWVWPSVAATIMKVDFHIELIDETDPYFEDYAKLAGPKPQIPIEEVSSAASGEGSDDADPEGDH